MNGIIQKLAESGIDFSADNVEAVYIFDSGRNNDIYSNAVSEISKVITICGEQGFDYRYWGIGVFELNKTSRTSTRLSFEEYHNVSNRRITDMNINENGVMSAVFNNSSYARVCAVYLKS